MKKCLKCGRELTDNDLIYWKCTKCGKVFTASLLKLKNLQRQKKLHPGQAILKCPGCGYGIDDGKERMLYKCPDCGSTTGGNLDNFVPVDMNSIVNVTVNNLMRCPECSQQISIKAYTCPNCGYPIRKQFPMKKVGFLVALLLLIFGGVFWFSVIRLDTNEKQAVESVIAAISDIGETKIESSNIKITKAEEMYNELSKKCQYHVTNHKKLLEAMNNYNSYKAKETNSLIDQIGNVTLDSYSIIDKAKESYDALSEDQKKLVTNQKNLFSAIEKITNLKIENAESKISAIGTVTLKSDSDIKEARELYNKLTNDEKSYIKNYDDLKNAENKYNQLAINNCISLIDAIGTVTLESKSKIDKAKKIYSSLSKELQRQITNHSVLLNARDEYKKLEKEEEERKKRLESGDSFSTSKWEVTYLTTNIAAKILPDNPSGYYSYYYADDDETFLDIIFHVKNINTDILSIENLAGDCEVKYDGNTFTKNYSLFTSNGSDIDKVYSWDGLDALNSTTLHIAIHMPRELQTNSKSVVVKLTIAGKEKIINVR